MRLRATLLTIRDLVRSKAFLIPLAVFVAYYLLHFWFTLVSGDVLYGGPGDHTAGLIWLYDNSPSTPWWTVTDGSGYPWGDQLWSPLFITGQIGYILFWIFSTVLGGAVAGYNAYIALGLGLSFWLSYAFIYRKFLKKPFIAALIAVLMISSPAMFAIIEVGHPSYVFAPAYFVSAAWLSLKVLGGATKRWSLSLGLLLGSTIFFDPYFVLMITPIVAVFFICSFIRPKLQRVKQWRVVVRSIVPIAAGLLIFALPAIGYVYLQSDAIETVSSGTRSPIREDAYAYSAHPEDFLLPATQNPLTLDFLKHIKESTTHGTDRTFTLYVGTIVLIMTIVAAIWWVRNFRRVKPDDRLLAGSLLAVALVAFLMSLPPTLAIFGLEVIMPSWIVTEFVEAWRVFARFFFILQPALLLFLAVTLSLYLALNKHTNRKRKYIYAAVVLLLLLSIVDYLPRNPLNADYFWSYDRDLPATYQTLRKESFEAMAEYPLREQPHHQGALYFTGQHIHNKKMLNAYSPTNSQALVRLNIMDLNNPQTIPVLQFLRISKLVVWNSEFQSWNSRDEHLMKTNSEAYRSRFGTTSIDTYTIAPGEGQRYLGAVEKGYRPDDRELRDIMAPLHNGVRVGVVDLCTLVDTAAVCRETPEKKLTLRGLIYNSTDTAARVSLKNTNGDTVTEFLVGPRQEISIAQDIGIDLYVMEFDDRLNEKIFYKDVHVTES